MLAGTALAALISCGLFSFSAPAWSQVTGVTGGVVVGGQATIANTAPGQVTVTQSTQRGVIDWRTFSIATGERVDFLQPGTSSVTLNRVTGPDPSVIAGRLTATGQLILVNGAGIVFANGAQINAAGLVASTAGIADPRRFMQGGTVVFDRPSSDPNAAVVNAGTITVRDGGLVGLVGNTASNSGVINARLGRVTIGGAETFMVDLAGDGLINFQLGNPVSRQPVDAQGNKRPLASNTGTINADGGTVTLTARAARGVVDNVVNAGGVINARAVRDEGGVVVFGADDGGTVNVTGTVDVSGAGPDQRGGQVVATAANGRVNVASTARIDASGTRGGGTVLVGGSKQGQGPVANASNTNDAQGATIRADATGTGSGGTVIVWADNATVFGGTISAKGGPQGGDGGFVETSGKTDLTVSAGASVNASAIAGRAGTWLLDPRDVVITSSGGSVASGVNNPPNDPGPTGTEYTIDAASIAAALNGSNVEITTNATGIAPFNVGNITVNSAVTWTTANTLTLTAAKTIAINADMTASAGGGLTLKAAQVTASGAISSSATINLGTGVLTLSAGTGGVTLSGPITAGTVNFTATGSVVFNNAANAISTVAGTASTAGGLVNISSSTALSVGAGGINAGTSTVQIATTGATSDLAISGAVTGKGGVTLVSGRALTLGASVDASSGTLALTSAGTGQITQSAGTLTAGTLTILTAGQNATLGQVNAITNLGASSLGAGTLTLNDAGGLTVSDAVSATGGISLTTTAGTLAVNSTVDASTGNVSLSGKAISQTSSGTITAAGLMATATGGDIDLTQATSTVTTFAATAVAGNIGLKASGGLVIGSVGGLDGITASGNVQLSLGGTVTQTKAVSAAGLAVTITIGDVSLTGATNSLGTFAASALGFVALVEADGVAVGSVAPVGALTTLSGITALAATVLGTGGTLAVNAPITMTNGDVVLSGTSISQTSAGVITTNGLAVTGTGGNIDLTQATSAIVTFAAKATTGSIGLLEADGFVIGAVDTLTGITASATVQLKAGGNITQTNAVSAAGLAITTTSGDINLTGVTNSLVTFAASAPGFVALVEADGVAVGSIGAIGVLPVLTGITALGATSLSTGGTLAINAAVGTPGGDVVLSGTSITQTSAGAITANGLAATATTGDIDLTQATSVVTTFAASATKGNIGFRESDGFDIAEVRGVIGITASGNVQLSAGGSITQTQVVQAAALGVTATGLVDLTTSTNIVATFAASITGAGVGFLESDGFSVGSVGAVGALATLNGVTTTGGTSAVSLKANGSITQTKAIAAAGGLAAVTTSGDINFGSVDNATSAIAFTSAGNVTYRTASSLKVTEVSKIGTLDSVAGINAASGTTILVANASASITQDKAIDTATLDISTAGSGNVTLTNNANLIGTVQSSGGFGTGTVQVTDTSGGLAVGPMAGSGSIAITTEGGALTVTGAISTNGAGATISLASTDNTVAVNAALNAGTTGTVALRSGASANITVDASATVIITAGTLTLETGGSGGVTIGTGAGFSHNIATVATAGTGIGTGGLTFTQDRASGLSVGPISSKGAVSISENTGALTVGGSISTTSDNVTLTAAKALTINNQISAGSAQVTLTANGGDITQNAGGAIAASGGITMTASGSILLAAGVDASNGALSLTSGANGIISQTGGVITAGALTVDTQANPNVGDVTINASGSGGTLEVAEGSRVAGDLEFIVGTRTVRFLGTNGGTTDVGGTVRTSNDIEGSENLRAAAGVSSSPNVITATGAGPDFDLMLAALQAATGSDVTIVLNRTAYTVANSQVGNTAVTLTWANAANKITGPVTIRTRDPGLSAGTTVNYNLVQSAALDFGGKTITIEAGTALGAVTLNNTGNTGIAAFILSGPSGTGITNIFTSGDLSVSGTATKLTTNSATLKIAAPGLTVAGAVDVTVTGNVTQMAAAPISAASLDVTSTAGSVLFGSTVTVTGKVSIAANNDITQTSGAPISATSLTATSTAGSVLLESAANNVTTFQANATAAGQLVRYRDADAFVVAGITTNAASGIVSLLSLETGGAISGAITQTGGITASELLVRAPGTGGSVALDLSLSANSVQTIAGTAAGDFTYFNATSLTVGTVLNISGVESTAGTVQLVAGSGTLTVSSNVSSAANVGLVSGGNIVVDGDVTAGSANLVEFYALGAVTQSGGVVTGGSLKVDAASGITLTGTNAIAGGGTVALNATGGSIAFTNTSGFVIGTLSGSAPFAPATTSGITTAAGGTAALTIGGDLTQASGGANIISAGTLSVVRMAGTNPNVTLGNASNKVSSLGPVSLGQGALTLVTSSSLTISDAVAATGGISLTTPAPASGITINANLDAGLAGAITLDATGSVTQSAITTITAASVDAKSGAGSVVLLTSLSNAFSTITGSGPLGFSATTTRALTLGTGGVQSSSGAVILTANGASSDIIVNNAVFANGNISVTAGRGITVNARVTSTAGIVTFSASGDITDTASGGISAPGLRVVTTGGSVDLSNAAGFNNVASLAGSASGSFTYVDNNTTALTITQISTAGVTATTGGVTVTVAAGTLTVSQPVQANTQALLTSGGDMTVNSTITVSSGNVTLQSSGKLGTTGNIQGTVVSMTSSGDLAIGALVTATSGDVTATSTTGALTVTAAVTASAPGGDVTLQSNGDLSLSAGLTAGRQVSLTSMAGSVVENAGGAISAPELLALAAGNVDLLQFANTAGATAFAARATTGYVVFINNGAINLDQVGGTNGVTAGSTVVIANAGGNITQTGNGIITAGNGLLLSTSGSIVLDQANLITGNIAVFNAPGDITLRNTGAINVGTVGPVGSIGAFSGITGGAGRTLLLIADTGAITQGSGAGDRIIAGGLQVQTNNNNVTLANASNQFDSVGSSNLGTGRLTVFDSAAGLTLSSPVIADGGVILTTLGAFVLPGSIVVANGDISLTTLTGSMSLGSTLSAPNGQVQLDAAGIITQTGGTITARSLVARAASGVDLTLGGNDVAVIAGSSGTGAFAYRDTTGITIGTLVSSTAEIVSGVTAANQNITIVAGSGTGIAINAPVNAGIGTVRLQASQGDIVQAAASPITATTVLANAFGGSVDFGGSTNTVTNIAGSALGSTFTLISSGPVTITTVAGDGITAGAAGIVANNGDITLVSGGAITLNGVVNAANGAPTGGAGAGNVVLIASGGGISQIGTAAIVGNNLLAVAVGSVDLPVAANHVVLLAGSSAIGTFRYRNAGALVIGAIGGTSGVTTSNQDIGIHAGGDLTLSQSVNALGSAGTLTAVVRLQATTGNVAQSDAGIVAAGMLLANAIGSGSVVLTNQANAVLNTAVVGGPGFVAGTAAGNFRFVNGNSLTVNGVAVAGDAGLGIIGATGVTAGNGRLVDLGVAAGNLSIQGPIAVNAGMILYRRVAGAQAGNLTIGGPGANPGNGTGGAYLLIADLTGSSSLALTGLSESGPGSLGAPTGLFTTPTPPTTATPPGLGGPNLIGIMIVGGLQGINTTVYLAGGSGSSITSTAPGNFGILGVYAQEGAQVNLQSIVRAIPNITARPIGPFGPGDPGPVGGPPDVVARDYVRKGGLPSLSQRFNNCVIAGPSCTTIFTQVANPPTASDDAFLGFAGSSLDDSSIILVNQGNEEFIESDDERRRRAAEKK